MNWLIQWLRSMLDHPKRTQGTGNRLPTREEIEDQTLEHAKVGYRNSQDVIKSLDGKTGVVTGLSTLSAGFLFALVKWSIESPASSPRRLEQLIQSHAQLACTIYAAVLASLLCALICLATALWSVVARDRPKHLSNRFTVLFPIYPKAEDAEAKKQFAVYLQGMTKAQILREYEDQLRIVGLILYRKIRFNRWACWSLLFQFVFIAVALSLILFLYLLG